MLGLKDPHVIEWNIAMTLKPIDRIPISLAMTPENNASHVLAQLARFDDIECDTWAVIPEAIEHVEITKLFTLNMHN